MTEYPDIDDPDAAPPSAEGELVPRASEAFGVRVKLETYSLDVTHTDGGGKARGFERILGITIEDIDYLEGAIYTGVQLAPVIEVRDNGSWGIKCVVLIPVRGRGEKSGRLVDVTTSWEIRTSGAAPRLVTAFPAS
jgi:hypothetical protein